MKNTVRLALEDKVGRPLSEVVAENVRAESARRGLLAKDLGAVLGLSTMAIYDRGKGRTPWTLDEVQVLALALRVPLAALLVDHSARSEASA